MSLLTEPRVTRRTGEWIASAVLAVVGLWAIGLEPRAVTVLYLAAATPALVRADVGERRLPNRLVLPGALVALASTLGEWLVSGQPPIVAAFSGLGYLLFLLALAVTGGMGMGDVKLGAVLGLSAGLAGVSVAVLSPVLAFVAGGIAGVIALRNRERSIPFGPFMLGGFWVALVLCALVRP